MANIPNAVLSDTVRELLSGRRVTAAVFMTYTLEPQFFEEEIVPLLTNEALSIQPKCRLLQLEELLRSEIGPVAVYYDRSGLQPEGSARLDIRYKPLHVTTGVFHPKVVLLLTEANDKNNAKIKPALICGIMSANLTKSGWWSCLESAHFETVVAGAPCSFRVDLRTLIAQVLRLGAQNGPHDALDLIHTFVKQLSKDAEQTGRARLRPRICAGHGDFTEFLAEVRGALLRGSILEIISPFFDEANADVLRKLTTQLAVRKTFVFHPRRPDGSSPCAEGFYSDLLTVPRVKWAKMKGEESFLRLGKEKHARPRSVHAKVYRFTSPDSGYEAIAVGSHNLTGPALRRGGNFEASFFLEVEPDRRVESWLETDEVRPQLFNSVDPELQDELPADKVVLPLQLKFDWTYPESGALLWEGTRPSPRLELTLGGAPIFSRATLPSNEWQSLGSDEVVALKSRLVSTALLTVTREDGAQSLILVQESGMAAKESILLTWTPTDVLAYWSQLSQAQRTHYLEVRLMTNSIEGNLDAEKLKLLDERGSISLFETSAGIFHGFEMLREQVCNAITQQQFAVVDYLLFGSRHDSLPTVLSQIEQNIDGQYDAVTRYLYCRSAVQTIANVRTFMKEKAPEKYDAYRSRFSRVEKQTHFAKAVRAQLDVGEGGDEFLNWFDEHFRQRVKAVEHSN